MAASTLGGDAKVSFTSVIALDACFDDLMIPLYMYLLQ